MRGYVRFSRRDRIAVCHRGADVRGVPRIDQAGDDPRPGDAGGAVAPGDLLLVADCAAAAIFQATAFDAGSGVISHDVVTPNIPGNTTTNLGHAFGSDASVYRLVTKTYFLAPSSRKPGITSLWVNRDRKSVV